MKRFAWLLVIASSAANAWTVVAPGLGGWDTKRLTFQYNFTDCPMSEASMLSILDQAIAVLNAGRDTGLTVVRASAAVTTTVAQIANSTAAQTPLVICDANFTASQSLNGDRIPAVTRLGSSAGRVAFAGLILNAEAGKDARISALSTDKLIVALVHEMGHVLGLGHSSNSLALMFYDISNKPVATLSQDDMDGISYLYPRDELAGGFYGCANAHRPRSPANALWVIVFLGVSLGLGRVFYRPIRPERLL